MATRRVRRGRRRAVKGGGYTFGGSILNQSAANAGNPLWSSNTGSDCSVDANRAGNGAVAGGRRRSRRRRSRRRTFKGGADLNPRDTQLNPSLVQSAPRTGWSFNGDGVAGTADTVPY